MHDRPATREEGLRILDAFTPRMGQAYASGRNFDLGPDAHQDVSTLSPYIRRRLVTEREIVAAALDAHGPENAEKFIQEVVWRGYFKGWLERRPAIWQDYRAGLTTDLDALSGDADLAARVQSAENGTTGLACFDAWADELVSTGYLHNHARMWFASIWIFSLGLPWRIGADFFYRHLLDGDPASNTLSWRWVAGLHTRGKTYEAQAWNISKFTKGRFAPAETDLASDVEALHETEEPDGLPDVVPLRSVSAPEQDLPTALLITEEDARVEEFDIRGLDIRGVATLSASALRSSRPVAGFVQAFERDALRDAADRIGRKATALQADAGDDLVDWIRQTGARQVVTPYIPEGPLRDWLRTPRAALEQHNIELREWRREWDALIWPHATAGFFKVKKRIPEILHTLEML